MGTVTAVEGTIVAVGTVLAAGKYLDWLGEAYCTAAEAHARNGILGVTHLATE